MTSAESNAPNFFVVGAPKAGTTSLYRYLDQHPDIFMSPIKEPAFFAPEVVDFTLESREAYVRDAAALRAYLDGPMSDRRGHGIVLDWSDYLLLFRSGGSARARGEVSGNYLASARAAARIRERIPHARIIMMLRNPVDRLFSHYASARSAGATTSSFSEWVTEQESAEVARLPRFGPIWTGMYADHVRRFRGEFPVRQIQVHLYEEYCRHPASVIADIFEFLQVDPTHPVDTGERHNVSVVPRWPWVGPVVRTVKPVLESVFPSRLHTGLRSWYHTQSRLELVRVDRERVLDMYRDNINELADTLGQDLSAWLRV